MQSQLNVEVRDTVFNPNVSATLDRQVHVQQKGDTYLYKVWIYLDGPDLPYVKSATYHLHSTFGDAQVQKIARSVANPNCQISIWTWGLFTVRAEIEDKRGNIYEVAHELSYDKQLPSDEANYLYEQDRAASSKPTLKHSR